MNGREKIYLNRKREKQIQNRPIVMTISKNGVEVSGGIECGGCGMKFNQPVMLECHNGEETEWLCPDCNDGTWYCKACGQFCAGITSFEFGALAGYCDNCQDEIRSTSFQDEDDDEYYYNEFY